jgi:hypothetical protein
VSFTPAPRTRSVGRNISGRVVFGEMDEVVFGKPAAEAIAEQAQRLGATGVFLMARRRKAEFAVKSLHRADLPWARNRLAVRYVRRRDQTRRLRPWKALAGRGSPGLGALAKTPKDGQVGTIVARNA